VSREKASILRNKRKSKVKKLSRYHHVGAKGERIYSSYSFLAFVLDVVSGQRYASAALYPREGTPPSGTHWTGGWVDLRADVDTKARGKIVCLYRGLIKRFCEYGDGPRVFLKEGNYVTISIRGLCTTRRSLFFNSFVSSQFLLFINRSESSSFYMLLP
jgi:hypothetical protein